LDAVSLGQVLSKNSDLAALPSADDASTLTPAAVSLTLPVMPKSNRPKVSLGLKKDNIPALLDQAKALYNGLKAHPEYFPNPTPSLAVLLGLINALDTAQQAMASRAPGAAALRDNARDALVSALESEGAYIQAEADAHPTEAVAMIEAANTHVAATHAHDKAVLVVKCTTAGSVSLTANATVLTKGMGAAKVTCHWKHTPDKGVTWVESASTPTAKTEIHGLQPLVEHGFCVCAASAGVTGEWSPVLYLLVK
jgi:hypothetical protein